MDHLDAALWGFMGAFIFAGPNLTLCLYQCHKAGKHPLWCLADCIVALAIGAVAAAGGTVWGADFLGADDPQKVPGIAILIGLIANPLAPGLIRVVPKSILRRIEGQEPPA